MKIVKELIMTSTINTHRCSDGFPETGKMVKQEMGGFGPLSFPLPPKQLPWLFTMNFHKGEQGSSPSTWRCKLFDPIYKNKYITFEDDFDCRNQDWFTSERWESGGCEVWASIEGVHGRFTTIHVWRATDKTWRETTLKKSISFSCDRMVFWNSSSLLCCYSKENMVGIDLSGNTVGEVAFPDLPLRRKSMRMVESDGELLLVCVRDYYHGPKADYVIRWRASDESWEIPHVFKLVDPLRKMSWVRLETIGNRALFLTCKYAISLEVSNQSETSILEADGIYSAVWAPFLVVYSLKKDNASYVSRIYHSFTPNSEKWVGYVEPPRQNCMKETCPSLNVAAFLV